MIPFFHRTLLKLPTDFTDYIRKFSVKLHQCFNHPQQYSLKTKNNQSRPTEKDKTAENLKLIFKEQPNMMYSSKQEPIQIGTEQRIR